MQRRRRVSQERGVRPTARLCTTAPGINNGTSIKRGLRLTPVQTRGRKLGAESRCVGRELLIGGLTTRQVVFVRERSFRMGRTR